MLGDLIANLDRPDVAAEVLTTLDPVRRRSDRAPRRSSGNGEWKISPPAQFVTS